MYVLFPIVEVILKILTVSKKDKYQTAQCRYFPGRAQWSLFENIFPLYCNSSREYLLIQKKIILLALLKVS